MNRVIQCLLLAAMSLAIATTAFCDQDDVAYVTSGRAKMASDWDGAIADFTKAIQLRPDNADAYYYRGLTKPRAGGMPGKNHYGAIDDFTKVIDLKPGYAEAYAARGVARALEGDFDDALTDLLQGHRTQAGLCGCIRLSG